MDTEWLLGGWKPPTFPTKVLICVPSTDFWHARFGMSLLFMVNYELSKGRLCTAHNKRGSLLSNMREAFAKEAIEGNFTHLLFVDSDMEFPYFTLERLLGWNKELVACACATRREPANSTAFVAKGQPLYLTPDLPPLMPIWRVGTGVMLIRTQALRRIPRPRFPVTWQPEIDEAQGEDWGMMEKFHETGLVPYVDTVLSKRIGHLGVKAYTHADIPWGSSGAAAQDSEDGHPEGQRTSDEAGVPERTGTSISARAIVEPSGIDRY